MKGKAGRHSKRPERGSQDRIRPAFLQRYGVQLVAILIAVGAFVLRYDLSHAIHLGTHMDESIITRLSERATNDGLISANWDGFTGTWFTKSTYQFSPYSLIQEGVALTADKLTGWPNSLRGHQRLARTTSCVFGALTILLVFFTARELFGNNWSALYSEIILAVGFLHVQDSIYARVEAFLCMCIVLCLYCSAKSLTSRRATEWSYATAFVAGVAIAAKYNALPVLVLVAFAVYFIIKPFQSSISSSLIAIAKYGLVMILGFVMATPEILIDPQPLIDGALSEYRHYAKGHIPHEAFDFWDNNLFYFSRYLMELGLGVVSCLLALGFLYLVWRVRTVPAIMLATFLCVAFVLGVMPTVRFERNLEVFFGPLAIAAGTTAGAIVTWASRRYTKPVVGLVAVGLLLGIIAQPAVTLFRFRGAVRIEAVPQIQYLRANAGRDLEPQVFLMNESPPSERIEAEQVVLIDHGDPFSRANEDRWEQLYAPYDRVEYRSPWSDFGYVFSTIDVYHGPSRYVVFTRPESESNPTQGQVEESK